MTPGQMNREQRRAAKKRLFADAKKQPDNLVEIPRDDWANTKERPTWLAEVWRSKKFLVQIYAEPTKPTRITVSRAEINGKGWADGITWDELQQVKKEVGYGDEIAIEIFPPNDDMIKVANMRHLWIVPPDQVPFMWRNGNA